MTTYSPSTLLSSELRFAFEKFSTNDQKSAVYALQSLIHLIRDGTDEQRRAIGVPMGNDRARNELNAQLLLDKCYWQLSQFFRVSYCGFVVFSHR